MGRRNINTTKSGKYMNPTDQARKEARKKELKKNKKQRQMVRAAVLKGKDPAQLIVEMEKMDQMEYNVEIPPALSEKVLKDKRKKLRETLDRVLKMYEKENPEYWVEIRRMVADYEKKRMALIEYYEAVRHAQAVSVDEIPLPNLEMPPPPPMGHFDELPPPPPHSILKKQPPLPASLPDVPDMLKPPPVKQPPGCPPSLPPSLSDDEEMAEVGPPPKTKKIRFRDEEREDDDSGSDSESDKENGAKDDDKSKGLTSLQAKLLLLSGQDVDKYVRETEVLLQEKEADKQADLQKRLDKLKDDKTKDKSKDSGQTAEPSKLSDVMSTPSASNVHIPGSYVGVPPGGVPPMGVPPVGVPPSGMPSMPMFRPPPPRPGMPPPPMGVRLPPGPPPQNLGPMLPQGVPRLPNMRLPPPMRPPGVLGPPGLPRGPGPAPPGAAPNVLSAGPQLVPRPRLSNAPQTATIQAKPQIRSLSADVTRFLPTALRVKREDKKRTGKSGLDGKDMIGRIEEAEKKRPTKDDAYSQFMREMEDLL